MTKPTAAQKKAFEKEISALGISISKLAESIEKAGIGIEGVAVAFAHLNATLAASLQRCTFAAQTNDAGNFSLDAPIPAASAPPAGVVPSIPGVPHGFVPRDQFEGRYVGSPSPPQAPVLVAEDSDGDGMLMVP